VLNVPSMPIKRATRVILNRKNYILNIKKKETIFFFLTCPHKKGGIRTSAPLPFFLKEKERRKATPFFFFFLV
jgi:hypothetical protein